MRTGSPTDRIVGAAQRNFLLVVFDTLVQLLVEGCGCWVKRSWRCCCSLPRHSFAITPSASTNHDRSFSAPCASATHFWVIILECEIILMLAGFVARRQT